MISLFNPIRNWFCQVTTEQSEQADFRLAGFRYKIPPTNNTLEIADCIDVVFAMPASNRMGN